MSSFSASASSLLALAHQLADALALGVALRLQLLDLRQQPAALLIQSQHLVHRRVEGLQVGHLLSDKVGLFADDLDV